MYLTHFHVVLVITRIVLSVLTHASELPSLMQTRLQYFSLGLSSECLSMIMLNCVNSFAIRWQESGENMIHRYLSSKSDIYAKIVGT
jgi:hypothetical protein